MLAQIRQDCVDVAKDHLAYHPLRILPLYLLVHELSHQAHIHGAALRLPARRCPPARRSKVSAELNELGPRGPCILTLPTVQFLFLLMPLSASSLRAAQPLLSCKTCGWRVRRWVRGGTQYHHFGATSRLSAGSVFYAELRRKVSAPRHANTLSKAVRRRPSSPSCRGGL